MLAFEAMDLLRGRGPLTDAEVNNITKTVVIGVTYPNLTVVPTNLQFSCSQVHQPGYYVNMEPQAGCQVYHRCELDLPLYTFLCPVGKLFNQITLNCKYMKHGTTDVCDTAEMLKYFIAITNLQLSECKWQSS